MYRFQRPRYNGKVVATIDDFNIAVEIWLAISATNILQISETEKSILTVLRDSKLTQNQIAERVGITVGRVSQILHGRRDRKGYEYGLLDKIKGLSVENITIEKPDGEGSRTTKVLSYSYKDEKGFTSDLPEMVKLNEAVYDEIMGKLRQSDEFEDYH